ncbi:MAG: BlaI/MecI/CopY family transcriptional regulator [Deltaproteobacteria bacterium]
MQIPLLGELETAVLELIWTRGAVEAKDVHRELGPARDITLNTIQSTLERLHRKRLLARERISHAYRYAALMSRDEFRARAVAGLAGTLRGAEGAGVIAAFVELAARADKGNLDRLEQLIAEARTRRGAQS